MVLDANIGTALLPQILRPLHTVQSKLSVDTIHASLVLDSNGSRVTTKVHIELLKRLVLRLRHKLPHKHRAHRAKARKEDVGAVRHARGGQHVLGGEANDKVEHPVRRGGDGDTLGPQRVGEDLLRKHPRDRAPRVGEVDGEQPDEDDGGPAGVAVRGPVRHEAALDTGDDRVAHHHTDGTADQELLAAKVVEPEDGWDGEEDLEDTGDTGGEQGDSSGSEAEGLEDLGSVVQNGVDTSLCEINISTGTTS